MSVAAYALVRVPPMAIPAEADGYRPIFHEASDAAILLTGCDLYGVPLDEIVLSVRRRLGAALDQHDDPRGLLIVPNFVAEDASADAYDALVAELGGDGLAPMALTYAQIDENSAGIRAWFPVVPDEHIPLAYATAAADTVDGLIYRALLRERDAGLARNSLYGLLRFLRAIATARADWAPAADKLAVLRTAMGAAYVEALIAALKSEAGKGARGRR